MSTSEIQSVAVGDGRYAREWREYLAWLDSVLDPRTVASVRDLWARLEAIGLWAPEASPNDEGDFHMAWDRGEHHLQVLVFKGSEKCGWLYRDRVTGEHEWEEEAILGESVALSNAINRLVIAGRQEEDGDGKVN